MDDTIKELHRMGVGMVAHAETIRNILSRMNNIPTKEWLRPAFASGMTPDEAGHIVKAAFEARNEAWSRIQDLRGSLEVLSAAIDDLAGRSF